MRTVRYGLYIHIPYCGGRCRYCDFYTSGGHTSVPNAYVDALLRDFALYAPRGEDRGPCRPYSVYFGGGTPGLLSGGQLARILGAVNPARGAEVTLETNPEAVGEREAGLWRAAGVNRLSLGVQSARDASLRALGRRHTAKAAETALRRTAAAGFENISGDIMLALPHYSGAEFDETLDLLRCGGCAHISAYLLKIEAGTAFGKAPPRGLPCGDEAAEHYLYACERLTAAGYAQYEISNFARRGRESAHNMLYWNAGHWLGLGPAAHSCLFGRRFSFAADTRAFLGGGAALREEGPITAEDYIMLRLRLAEGLREEELYARFGAGFSPRQRALAKRLCGAGYAVRTAGGFALSPRGMLVQNSILAEFLE